MPDRCFSHSSRHHKLHCHQRPTLSNSPSPYLTAVDPTSSISLSFTFFHRDLSCASISTVFSIFKLFLTASFLFTQPTTRSFTPQKVNSQPFDYKAYFANETLSSFHSTSPTSITMSGKLDKSLDEILSTRRQARHGSQRRQNPKASRANNAPAAPIGGVKKSTRQAKAASKAIPTKPAGGSGEGKIIVSGLVSLLSTTFFKPLVYIY